MSRIKFKAAFAYLLVFSLLFSTNLPAITLAQVTDPVVDVTGSVSADLGSPASAPPGRNSQTDPASVVIVLHPRNEAAYQASAEAVSDPDSPTYQKPVSDADYRQNYQPDAATVASVKKYFTGQGMTLSYESTSELVLSFSTTLAQRDKAFGTTTEYRTNTKGEAGLINTTPLQLPASVAKNISGVLGFDELHQAKVNSVGITPGNSPNNVTPNNIGSVTPAQMRAAYSFPSAYTGTGMNVANILWTAPDLTNTNRWKSDNSISGAVNLIAVDPSTNITNTVQSGDLEAHMDIQMILTAAPSATVRYYVAKDSTFGSLSVALQKAVDDNVTSLNGSWGNCESTMSSTSKSSYHTIFVNAAAKGIPFFFSSGDSGAFECNSDNTHPVAQVGYSQFPASDPLVTSVGGTSLDHTGNTWNTETAWSCDTSDGSNDASCLQGNGGSSTGGRTVSYDRPAYQSTITPPTEPKFTNIVSNTRVQPDISMNGDPASGERIYINGCSNTGCPLGGGTSASSPLMAGIAALAVQKKGVGTGSPNKFLYRYFPGNWGFDVTSGYNGVTAKTGWDYTTGLGSIKNVTNYLNAFATQAPFLTATSVTFSEVVGNSNGNIDPGETIGLKVNLANSGDAAATGVSGTLALTGGSATLINPNSTYQNIAVNGSANNDTNFTFSTDPNLSCATVLSFRLTVSYNGGLSYTYNFNLTVGAAVAGPAQTFSNTTAVAIPDNNPAGVTSSLSVPASFVAADVNVTVNITHTYDSDLTFKLIGPDNYTTVVLAAQEGGGGDNYTGTIFDSQAATAISAGSPPFTGSFQPEQSLNVYNNTQVNGTWKLFVVDGQPSDMGTLNNWSLALKPLTYSCSPFRYPVPTTTSLSPSSKIVGSAAFTLTVNGSNFVNNVSVVRWNGSNRPTTFVNSGQLTVQIPATDLTSVGTATVTVFNPTPGGGTSGGQQFSVVNPVPIVTNATAPGGIFAGSDGFNLTVNGSNFVNGATVSWNNSPRQTTFVSGSQLTAQISSSDVSSSGPFTITVTNPVPGGGTSNTVSYSPVYTNPTLTVLTPGSIPNTSVSNHDFILTIKGNYFVTGSAAYFNNLQHTTTYLDNHTLTIAVAANELPSSGTAVYPVKVINPGSLNSTNTLNFNVVANCTDAPLVVTQTLDGPPTLCGSLRYALTNASGLNPKGTVSLAFSSGTTLSISYSITVPVGVSIAAACTTNGPGVILDATGTSSGLTLNGGSSLSGLYLKGFGNPVMAQVQALTGGTTANKASCTRVSKT